MKSFPGDWKMPYHLSGSSSLLIKEGVIAVCGGNNGQHISNKFFLITLKKN